MSISILRFVGDDGTSAEWGLLEGDDQVRPVQVDAPRTADLLAHVVPQIRQGTAPLGSPRDRAGLQLLSPVTAPCRLMAQALNYRSHAKEIGLSPEGRPNVLFTMGDRSLSGPTDAIVRPPTVQLLDYEIELGVVIGRAYSGRVTDANLADVVGALVVCNDVSARDIQVPDGQFYKGKSYPTFTPVGPILWIPEPEELARWRELRLTLRVNGEVRQNERAGDMIHAIPDTLTEIGQYEALQPGDLVLTGTPGGVALGPPNRWVRAVGELLPEATKWRLFRQGQARNPAYLQPGDRMEAHIGSDGGCIDLGTQRMEVG